MGDISETKRSRRGGDVGGELARWRRGGRRFQGTGCSVTLVAMGERGRRKGKPGKLRKGGTGDFTRNTMAGLFQ